MMRKEIIGICLFFLVILTLVSLVSFSPQDPSINHAASAEHIHNLFGIFGAHIAGILIGLFGLGAFWLPVMLLILSIHFFGRHTRKAMVLTLVGGFLLIIATGGLISLTTREVIMLGNAYSSGGLIGIPLSALLLKYAHMTGATLIFIAMWLIGLILATGFSMINFWRKCRWVVGFAVDRVMTLAIKYKERKKKSVRLHKAKKDLKIKKEPEIAIKTHLPPKLKVAPPPKQEVFDFMKKDAGFSLPGIDLLDDPDPHSGRR